MKKLILILVVLLIPIRVFGSSTQDSIFDMEEIRDARTLHPEILQDWHIVNGPISTRQKSVTISVGELWPGRDFRIPVRFIVPVNGKAKGFHLTGGHNLKQFESDTAIRGVDIELIKGGIGLVHTIVQEPRTYGEKDVGNWMRNRFFNTLNTRYSIQYWGWPAILMRATTAAYAESHYFEKGKIALSGGSKNGASPSVALIADTRFSALHASVSPPWESPLRLCDPKAWEALNRYNRNDPDFKPHNFLGGTFGPNYNKEAMAAGHSWEDIRKLANRISDQIFISRNLTQLANRNVDLLFHPGTHDMVAYDLYWGGSHYPEIPTYLRINSGHGKKNRPDSAEPKEQNLAAFLLNHFFGGDPLLEAPEVSYHRDDNTINITVTFKPDSHEESGRIWWMYDRGPDGSSAYIRELFPEKQWKDMKPGQESATWTAQIEIESGATHIDFFTNHLKTIHRGPNTYPTYISSPYTRINLK